MTSVLLLGYGAFGRAIHAALSHRPDLAVSVHSRSPKTFDMPVANFIVGGDNVEVAGYDVVVVAVPSHAVREVLDKCAAPSEATAFVSCVKGMEPVTGRFASDVISQTTGNDFVAVLSGASFAHEMLVGRPVFLTLACANVPLGQELVARLESETLQLDLIDDVRGLEIAGVGKNIIALGAGIADGREMGENFRAAFIARGIAELRRVTDRLGGRGDTIVASGALADFILSCSSPRSRNYEHGWRLGQGDSVPGALAEGRESAESFIRLLRSQRLTSPYFDSIAAAIDQPALIAQSLSTTSPTE